MTSAVTRPLWQWGATEIRTAVQRGAVRCADVVDSVYDRIDAVNPRVNAIVLTDRARARADAARLDDACRRGEPVGPLAGVPVSIKLNADVAGEATSNGTPLWSDRIAQADGDVVANLRRAGAIVIGRTNTPPHSFRWFTENPMHGRTQNPWRESVTPGGSSGGAGVAVATGMGPIAHGTDIAGSIRYPAYVNGVVGLRATTGRIAAFQPTAPRRFFGLQAMSAQGPLTRCVADARLALAAMAASGDADPLWTDVPLHYEDDDLPVQVAWVDDVPGVEIDPAVRHALERAAEALRAAGYRVERALAPDLQCGVEIWRSIVMTECRFGMLAAVDALGDTTLGTPVHAMMACAGEVDLAGYAGAIAARDELRREWNAFFRRFPLVLMPTSCRLPLPWGADQGDTEQMHALMAAQSPLMAVAACGLPGLHIPTGLVDGLPVGVQLVAPSFREMRLLRAGEVLEAACGTLHAARWNAERP